MKKIKKIKKYNDKIESLSKEQKEIRLKIKSSKNLKVIQQNSRGKKQYTY